MKIKTSINFSPQLTQSDKSIFGFLREFRIRNSFLHLYLISFPQNLDFFWSRGLITKLLRPLKYCTHLVTNSIASFNFCLNILLRNGKLVCLGAYLRTLRNTKYRARKNWLISRDRFPFFATLLFGHVSW